MTDDNNENICLNEEDGKMPAGPPNAVETTTAGPPGAVDATSTGPPGAVDATAAAMGNSNGNNSPGHAGPGNTNRPPGTAVGTATVFQRLSVDRAAIMREAIENYSGQLSNMTCAVLMENDCAEADGLRDNLLRDVNFHIEMDNAANGKVKGSKMRLFESLPGGAAARLLLFTGDIRKIITGTGSVQVAVKHYYRNASTGWKYKWSGIYDVVNPKDDDGYLMRLFRHLCLGGRPSDRNEFLAALNDAPACDVHADNMLVFFRNGVWDYRRQDFTAYDDAAFTDRYGDQVALNKLPVYHPYGPGAALRPDANGKVEEPVYHNDKDGTDWRPSQMVADPFDMDTDEGVASRRIILNMMQFMIRRMNRSPSLFFFWLDATEDGAGHNSKSTVVAMCRRLLEIVRREAGTDDDLGATSPVISRSIHKLDKDYGLAYKILQAYAIIGEEMDGSNYVDDCQAAKELSRNVEREYRDIYKSTFSYRYEGLLLQMANKVPKFSDRTDSMRSHCCVVRWPKTFTDDRAYIAEDYVLRETTAEWWAYYLTVVMPCLEQYDTWALEVLKPNSYEMISKSLNTFQFLDEFVPGLRMDFMPTQFLFEFYLRWCETNNITGKSVVTMSAFLDDLKQYTINPDRGVRFDSAKAIRFPKDDVNQFHRTLDELAYTPRLGRSDYVEWNGRYQNGGADRFPVSKLNPHAFLDSNQNGKVFYRGGLKRAVPWRDALQAGND